AFFKGGSDRRLDDLTGWVYHQTFHASHLGQLGSRTTSPRVDGDKDRAVLVELRLHGSPDLVTGLLPLADRLQASFFVGNQTHVVLGLDLLNGRARLFDNRFL